MLKKLAFLSVCSLSTPLFAAQEVNLYNASIDSLNNFLILEKQSPRTPHSLKSHTEQNTVELMNTTKNQNQTISRYQQKYKGIPVIGSEVIIIRQGTKGILSNSKAVVNGHILEDINPNIQPEITPEQATNLATTAWLAKKPGYKAEALHSELQLRQVSQGNLQLVYLISFTGIKTDHIPALPFFIVDAQTGSILKQWNNIQNYDDKGPGGNEKVQHYWYGEGDIPALNVIKKGKYCSMENDAVKLVHLKFRWDTNVTIKTTFKYLCGETQSDAINGAFSPNNDAYHFGTIIVNMYKDWYGLHALQTPESEPMQLVMRTHFGKRYDNAFWYKNTMNFGDGDEFYPLVSLDVAGHEVSHGFTEQHSNLEYHDQSGALNEAFSDMAGQATRAYLLETNPSLYNQSNVTPDAVTWGLGETIMRGADSALRYMDNPSKDGHSADCLSRMIAANHGATCEKTYQDIVDFANENMFDEDDIQSYIVHTASGVFNKAFYLMSEQIGIKNAFQIMVDANVKYWTADTDFNRAACDVVRAAQERNQDLASIHSVFGQVGIDSSNCII